MSCIRNGRRTAGTSPHAEWTTVLSFGMRTISLVSFLCILDVFMFYGTLHSSLRPRVIDYGGHVRLEL